MEEAPSVALGVAQVEVHHPAVDGHALEMRL
jgi:hypothetical protein